MKNTYKLFNIVIVLAVILTSCTDYLDLPPKNKKALSGIEDVRSVLSGYLFQMLDRSGSDGFPVVRTMIPESATMMFEAYSDNIDFENSIDRYLNFDAVYHTVNPKSDMEKIYANMFLFNDYESPRVLWEGYYASIGFLNALISKMENVTDGEQADYDRVNGELLTNRAFYFFKLLQYFAPMNDATMGIPVYLNTGENVVNVPTPRKTHTEVYAVIIDDLTRALEMAKRTAPQENFNIFYSVRRISHLLAEVYWYKAESPAKEDSDYENCKIHAQTAISGIAPLIPKTRADFELSRTNNDANYPATTLMGRTYAGIGDIYGSPYYYFAMWGFNVAPVQMTLTDDFVSMFNDEDIRRGYYIMGDNKLYEQFPEKGKYLYTHLFMPEEPYLFLAEAYYKLGDEGSAINVLNEFKSFRNSGDASTLSGDALYQEIQNERRKEFFGFGDYRWVSLKRYANKTLHRSITFFGTTYDITVGPNNYRYALPIPNSELQENPLMVQNPGWVQLEFN
jgi:hypothetical protein